MQSDWNSQFVDEHIIFTGLPGTAKDDSVDTGSLAFRYLTEGALVQTRTTEVAEPWQPERKPEREVTPWDSATSPLESFGGEVEFDV
jgi:hypothetical protein